MSVLMNFSTAQQQQQQHVRNKKSTVEENDVEEAAVPDSTTTIEKERPDLSSGQDVLVKHKDGRYYLGTIVEVDVIREQCLVKFDDNTESWSSFKDLTKLSHLEEDLLCVVCKKSAPKDKHEIVVCDKCRRGYHQRCHQPEIAAESLKDGLPWMCWRCLDSLTMRLRSIPDSCKSRKEPIRKLCTDRGVTNGAFSNDVVPVDKLKLPYDPSLLSWDTYHRINKEQIYCYCGENGEWYKQMLQCGRCRQWFHERCIGCLQFPLYCGDRFYIFVCSMCNYGKEFVRRLELKWVDLVHLLLFNLTSFNVKKYYDLDTVVIPYMNDNWHALQLPPKIFNISKSERRENILSILTTNRNRFKCGREIKKRTTIWGLRLRLPPPAPCVTLPTIGPITEEHLRERWQGNRRLQFLPYQPTSIKTEETYRMIVPVDPVMMGLMMGSAYQECADMSDNESPSPSPVDEANALSDNPLKLYKMDYEGGGFVKKSVPFPSISLQRRKRLLSMNVREKDKLFRRQKRKSSGAIGNDLVKLELKSKRFSLDSLDKRNHVDMPLTPPTSVSAPPTPPASSDMATELAHNLGTTLTGKNKLTKSNLSANGFDTPCDTSGDETSSKSTLDLIIPPPKDFEGKNNPFHALLKQSDRATKRKRHSKEVAATPPHATTAITLPLPLTAVIPGRPLKRQLSEKDICIGPNGEVKRRRLRRGRPVSKTAAVVPARPDVKDWGPQRTLRSSTPSQIGNCVDYALNGRRLRQRHQEVATKGQEGKNAATASPKTSPVKQEPDISMDDLKTSVNMYFGAANRIASGEPFTIRAKRVGPSGKTQYLIEWEAPVHTAETG